MIAEQYRKMLDAKSVIRQLSEKATITAWEIRPYRHRQSLSRHCWT